MKAIHLQTEHLSSPFGIDIQKPVLSWLCEGGVAQTAYEVEALSCGQVIWQSGRVTGNTMHTVLDAPLSSRQSVCWRVRLWDENGAAGPWSEPAAFELGLLSPADWQAQWIDPELQHDPSVHHPASYLRKTFTVGLLTENEAKAAAAELDRKIAGNGYHLNTGFLSTPLLCQVLADYGHLETAYRLLLQDTMPSWLYAVKRGATTIWERWDGIDPNGHPQGSLNHYSYGAVCAWLFCGVCGIRVEGNTVTIRPQPYPALEYARARYRSPLGEIVSGWRYEDGQPRYEIVLPANVTAAVELADGRRLQLEAGTHWL